MNDNVAASADAQSSLERLDRPSHARAYDHMLGGKVNFEVDRVAVDRLGGLFPGVAELALDNRALMRRAVRWLAAEAGIRQFLDLGAGFPTAHGNVHELAQDIDPDARVVYVDTDPFVAAYGRALLADGIRSAVIGGDIADPVAVLDRVETCGLIDRGPVAVLMFDVLPHLADEHAADGVRAFREWMPEGSYLAVSHLLADDHPDAEEVGKHFGTEFGSGCAARGWADVRGFLDGLQLVEPGLVYANEWRPAPRSDLSTGAWSVAQLAGIGRKP